MTSTQGIPRHGVVACVESLAADAGAEMLRLGGNAADAAIATAFAQGVVDPIYCGISGSFHGIFFDRSAGRTQLVMSGGRAPRAAHESMWQPAGHWGTTWQVAGDRNRLGYQASLVPGFVRGAGEAFSRFGSGRVTWPQLLAPSIALAEDGFEVYPYLYRLWMPSTRRGQGFIELGDGPEILGHTPASAGIYLHPDGSVYEVGERLVQRDYARTLRRIAEQGPDEFYEGETGRLIADDFARNDGLITADDLREYHAVVAEPIRTTYRDYTVLAMPPPYMGLMTLEVLNVLEGWDLEALGWNSAPYLDRLARAMYLGFQDHLAQVGDPEFVLDPTERLSSKAYAGRLRSTIEDDEDPRPTPEVGVPAGHREETTSVVAADVAGNAAAITHSTGVSSGVVTPGLGFLHNCHMIMFDPAPGRPNSIAGWKRPITGGDPMLFLRDGELALVIGSPAGGRKVSALIQAFLNTAHFGMDAEEAVDVDRIHAAEGEPRTIVVEPHFPPSTLMELARMGQRIRFEWYTARLVAVQRDTVTGGLVGGTDPRGDRGLAVV